jgi:hypothetical protein
MRNGLFDIQDNSASQQSPEFEQFVGIEIDTIDRLIQSSNTECPQATPFLF